MDARTKAIFPFSTENSLFEQIWSKKKKKKRKSNFLGNAIEFEFAEFNGAVIFLKFRPETPFLGKFGQKSQNCQYKLKFGT